MPGFDLRTARLNKGLSKRGLARAVNVPEQSIRRLEKGMGISPAYAKRIADYFEVQVVDIIDADDEDARRAA
ncbi:MAG TPA: helix-turn-helix transcriptional regulator [Gemmatimonadaceae bacterium]|nr:helix-turn-helix transcriptional regulator [Gemmatimonadaceae bacterium]